MSDRTIDLANEISKVLALGGSGEIDEQTMNDTLEGIEGMLEDKFDAAMSVIREFESNVEHCKKEAARFTERAKHWQRQVDMLKSYLLLCLVTAQRTKLKTVENTFSIRKGSVSLTIFNEGDIPDDYLISSTKVVVNEFDKAAIKKDLTEALNTIEELREKGEEVPEELLNKVPGARVERGPDTLSVR